MNAVHYSFTQSGGLIQNYFLSSAVSEATLTGYMTFFTPPTSPPGWGFSVLSLLWVLPFYSSPLRPLPPPPNRILRRPSRPDSADLRRTVWFCRRVWLLDCWSYSNRKEITFSIEPESMPVFSTMFQCLGGRDLGSALPPQNKNNATRTIIIYGRSRFRNCLTATKEK
jgi:hypothetical protein